MIPVAGSAYTYSYAVQGEFLAWTVGWALLLEYAVGASAVSVGWSNYSPTRCWRGVGNKFPRLAKRRAACSGRAPGGFINLPAASIALLMTLLLVRGTSESATFNSVLVAIKVTALIAFVILTLPVMQADNFEPFAPAGLFGGWGSVSALSARRRPCSSPMSASTPSRPRPKRPRTRNATCRSA
jgi:APA family basic amino acid/polyamine antiporter